MEGKDNHHTSHMFLFDSWVAKCPVLCHLFGCFDSRLKENINCHCALSQKHQHVVQKAT